MNWISNLFSRYLRNVHFGVIAVLTIVLIVGNPKINGVVSDAAVGIFYYPLFKLKNSITDLMQVHDENLRLQQALVDASVNISMLEEDRRENDRLRSVLGFEPPEGYGLLPAKVISITSDRIPISAVINMGSRDSVTVNQPVINEDGLIGRIAEVMPDYSTVQLLTDPTNRVAVRVAESREMGIAKFGITDGMIMDNFPIQAEVHQGDLIISSGLGGIYPAGLKVGTVSSVSRPEDEAFCDVRLKPAVNFNALDELFILRSRE
jgi:rod shape-determining protein MreC